MNVYIRQNIPDITTPWIYHDEVNWLISFSTDWENWTTIADKNLGATSSDITSSDSYGNLYQWWNNYWFPYAWASWWTISKSPTKVNAGSYWPWNYYSWSTFIYSWSENWDWSSSQNDNLGWNTTDTLVARRWPCDEWFHVPTNSELTWLLSSLKTITGLSTITWNNLWTYILLPVFWRLSWSNWSWASNNYRFLWSSTANWTTSYYLETANTTGAYTASVGRAWWFSVRPFKNTPVTPDESWTVIYSWWLKSYTEICQLTAEWAVTELNKYPTEYYNKLNSEWHILNNLIANSAGTWYQYFPREWWGSHYVMYNNWTWIDTL